MLSGTPAFLALVGTLLVVGALVALFRRALARAEEQERIEAAAREAYGRQLLGYVAEGNVNQPDDAGRTPLLLALEQGLDEVASQIIAYRPDLNARDRAGESALHYAARSGSDAVLHALLHAGVNPSLPNSRGETPLHVAATGSNPKCVELLLQYGADANLQDAVSGRTPLMDAALNARMDNVEILLGAGPDLSLRDAGGRTVVQLAQEEIPRRMGAYAEENTALMNLVMRLEAAEAGRSHTPKVYGHAMDEWDADGGPA